MVKHPSNISATSQQTETEHLSYGMGKEVTNRALGRIKSQLSQPAM
ncbi:MAG: hypothetical protein ACOYJG_12115 [Prevotella sp.]